MVLFSEMFASELIGIPVVDRVQENIGKVKDILITLGEAFPKVAGLLIITLDGKEKVLLIGEIDLIGRRFVSTRNPKGQVALTSKREGEVMLMQDIVDKQIVDLEGARVIRVNDLKLAKMNQDVRLIGADVGVRGMFRRLGLEGLVNWFTSFFHRQLPESLIGWDHVQWLAGGKITIPSKTISDLHPADVAQIISQLHVDEKTAIFSELADKTAAEALHELEPMLGAIIIANIDTKKALGVLEKMPVDEAADIIGDLTEDKAQELLRLMKVAKAGKIRELLKHHDETAGGLMNTEFITFPQDLTVEQTILRLREMAPEAETIYYLYVVDEQQRLVGILSLRKLIVSPPATMISDIMLKEFVTLSPEMKERETADIFSKYNLLAVPVVDAEKRILGIVTIDDVVDYILPPVSRRKRQRIG
ncbi:MAG: CBS domain-containing protein [Candidatus Margulisiibacteriota bacterium]